MQKFYPAKWTRWIYMPLFFIVWSYFTYLEFFSGTDEKLGIVIYTFITFAFWFAIIFVWLQTGQKLPSAIIKGNKIYAPRWYRFYTIPILFGLWIYITYLQFFQYKQYGGLFGTKVYIYLTIIFLGGSLINLFITSGKISIGIKK